MGLSQGIQNALGGLRATQKGIEVASRNIANANTAGYTKKSLELTNNVAGDRAFGVKIGAVSRQVDRYVQARVQNEYAAFNKLDVQTQFLQHIDNLFGKPGSEGSLDSIVNNVSTSLIDFANSPEQDSTRQQVIENASFLTSQMRDMSAQIQEMRQDTERMIAEEVATANSAMQNIARINYQLTTINQGGDGTADLKDQLDNFIDDLAAILNVRTTEAANGSIKVFTKNGILLVDENANRLEFDERANIGPEHLYSLDSNERGVGSIFITSGNGNRVDLLQQNATNSGRISGLLELRDVVLTSAQDQLDELAHGLATAFNTQKVDGTAITAGAAAGFSLDLSGLKNGNVAQFEYTNTATGITQKISFVRVDDASILPLDNNVTANSNDQVFGIDFSGSMASVQTQIAAALGGVNPNLSVSLVGASNIQIMDDGAAGLVNVGSFNALQSVTGLQGQGTALNFFTDSGDTGEISYTNFLEGGGQKLGFASRIQLNTALIDDNSLLIKYDAATSMGNQLRPADLLNRFANTTITFNANSGVGTKSAPFNGTIDAFTRQVVANQTSRIATHESQLHNQELLLSTLNSRMEASTKVDIDEEMSNLLNLQTAYAANARIVSVIKELMDMLIRM